MLKSRNNIKGKFYILLLISILLLLSNSSLLVVKAKEDNQNNVLVLNSYHTSFNWTHEESDGIISGLKASGNNVSISVEYMDWKNYNSEDNWNYLYEYYKYK